MDSESLCRSKFWQLESVCDILELKKVVKILPKDAWFELSKPSLHHKTIKKISRIKGERWLNFVLLDSKLN